MNWVPFSERQHDPGSTRIWLSEGRDDSVWDRFLVSNRFGHFQQSSAWARVKSLEGWRATRLIVTHDGTITAGFQVLWRVKFGCRFGYVSKGPVLPLESDFSAAEMVSLLQELARQLAIMALIVQPPDFDKNFECVLAAAGFYRNELNSVYSATALVDLARPVEEIERGFSHDVGRQIRKLRKSGVSLRTGSAGDAHLFFDLMTQSCARQKVAPNPSTPHLIRAILEEFPANQDSASNAWAQCLIAEADGKATAGYLLIRFGDTLSLWKKGSATDAARLQPNRLLDSEAMRWGHRVGCTRYDVVALERSAAIQLLAGLPRSAIPMKSSDVYKLDFGGTPLLLPESQIWFPSIFASATYRAFTRARARLRKAFSLKS